MNYLETRKVIHYSGLKYEKSAIFGKPQKFQKTLILAII